MINERRDYQNLRMIIRCDDKQGKLVKVKEPIYIYDVGLIEKGSIGVLIRSDIFILKNKFFVFLFDNEFEIIK